MDETLVFRRTGTIEEIRKFYGPLNSVNSKMWNGKPPGTVRFIHIEADRSLANLAIETRFLYRPEGFESDGRYAFADWSGVDFGEQVEPR